MKISIDRGYLAIVLFAVGSIAMTIGGAWLYKYNEKLTSIIALIILAILAIRPVFIIERSDKNVRNNTKSRVQNVSQTSVRIQPKGKMHNGR